MAGLMANLKLPNCSDNQSISEMFYPATTIKASAAEYIASSFRPFFKEKVEGNIGIELEFPILSVDEKPWPKTIIRSLNHFIQNSMNFESVVEVEGQPLVFQHPVWRDKISYEVTHSTLEFSMAPRNNIVDLEHSFKFYYLQIQDFLLGHNVFLACTGLHPFGYYRRHPALPHPHYLNITEFLRKYSKGHSPEFAFAPWLMIGSQTHIEAPWSQLSRFLNAYFSLGWCELILMANSYRSAPGAEWLCYRDYLIRGSGFGYNPENVNYPNQFFSSNNEYFERYGKKSIFTKKDGHQYLHFQPVKLEQIFAEDGLEIKPGIELMPSDVKNCLAFNPVRLTRYGTLEIRSTCQQPFDDLFAPAAFSSGNRHCPGCHRGLHTF